MKETVESYLGNQQEVLLPFVKAIVPSVDIAAGTLEITPPPGLLNPDEAEEVVNSKSSLGKHADAAPKPRTRAEGGRKRRKKKLLKGLRKNGG